MANIISRMTSHNRVIFVAVSLIRHGVCVYGSTSRNRPISIAISVGYIEIELNVVKAFHSLCEAWNDKFRFGQLVKS